MTAKTRQKSLTPNLRDGAPLPTPASGQGFDLSLATPYVGTFKLSSLTLDVAAADDFGSVKLCDLPDSNLLLLAVEVDLVLTKGGVTNGLEAAVDLDMGVGTAAASAQTLAGAMIDVIEKVDVDTNALAVDFEAISVGQATAAYPLQIADGASNALYINCGVPAGITADDDLTIDGTVRVVWIDLGNDAS